VENGSQYSNRSLADGAGAMTRADAAFRNTGDNTPAWRTNCSYTSAKIA